MGELVVESILAKSGQTRPYESHDPGLKLGRIRVTRIWITCLDYLGSGQDNLLKRCDKSPKLASEKGLRGAF